MPLIHFAFGKLFRDQNEDEQVKSFIDFILMPKALKAFVCPEFMPILSVPGGKTAVPSSAQDMGDGGVGFTQWTDSPPVSLLPNEVWMVSFVDIPFKKLSKWSPSTHYGHLGLVFTDAFRNRLEVRRVTYYQYPDLTRDPKVIAFNKTRAEENNDLHQRLFTDIVQFRKPARLWETFNTLFAPLRLTKTPEHVEIEQLTYSRYDVGYNFEEENEARLVKTEDDRFVQFEETDILAIVVPDENTKQTINEFVAANWSVHPIVMVYPE